MQTSLVDILRERAKNQPRQLAFRFLADGESEEILWTYEDTDRRARSVAALIQEFAKAGDRVLLLLPPGMDFIAGFWGCLYANVMAIPANPPHPVRPEKNLPTILRIIADAMPSVALLTSKLYALFKSQHALREELGRLKLLVTDNEELEEWAGQWQEPLTREDDIAFLQYTSGSTTHPRGVMVSNGNLIHNMNLIGKCFGVTSESRGVIWLPPYHDMGLIGGITQPPYSGIPVTLMPHMMFLQNPFRWLQAISRYQGTISGGPNFAYALCVSKVKPEQRAQIDLSRWEVAFNGAEPVYHKTLDQFAEYFEPSGFRREAFLPCYGLAESTLMVTGGPRGRPPLKQHLLSAGIEQHQVIPSPEGNDQTRTLVSCGQNLSEQQIRIVNADTLEPCPPGEIGEIWVSGPCVSSGYWNKPQETESAFGARLSGSGEGPFLRSGDLGFWQDGELYVTGRIKNLIISEGKNHYPQDIERTVESAHPAIWPGGCAVFSITDATPERIVVIAEVKHKLVESEEETIRTIRNAISDFHGLHVDDIRLTVPGGIPRTTSGKIRHFLCRDYYLAGTLKEIIL